MNIQPSLEANAWLAEASKPRMGALDNSSVLAQARWHRSMQARFRSIWLFFLACTERDVTFAVSSSCVGDSKSSIFAECFFVFPSIYWHGAIE
ncbi:protein of unknown function [Burkholderia multivorans]